MGKRKEITPGSGKEEEEQHLQHTRIQKTSRKDDGMKEQSKRNSIQAKCEDNQALVDALHELSIAMNKAQNVNQKNRFRSRALQKAAQGVAKLDYPVQSGDELAQGPKKVKGIGQGCAAYINEFIETGKLVEIESFNNQAQKEAQIEEEKQHHEGDQDDTTVYDPKNKDHVLINRAPVLTLWVSVVAQHQGYAYEEALTYAKWVSTILAQSKGKALGIFPTGEGSTKKDGTKRYRDEDVEYVQAFDHMKIPTRRDENNKFRLALSQGETLDPSKVDEYLESSFGDGLSEVRNAMEAVSKEYTKDEMDSQAYKLYEEFRPEYKGWGKPALLDLSKLYEMAKQKKRGQDRTQHQ